MKDIRVVIPAKNEEAMLPRLIDGLAAQKEVDFEVVLADADSTDRTAELARAAGWSVVPGGLPGPGRNRGAEGATSEWLVFLDADNEIHDPFFLKKALAELRERHLDFAAAWILPDAEGRLIDQVMMQLYNGYAFFTARVWPHAPGAGLFVKTSVFHRLHGFDETVVFAEDQEFAHRMGKAGYHFGVLRSAPVFTSMRRFIRDGYGKIAYRLLKTEWYMRFHGPIRKELFPYDFADYPRQKKDKMPSV